MSRATYYNLKKNTKKVRDQRTVRRSELHTIAVGSVRGLVIDSPLIPDKINKSTSKTKYSVGKHSGSTDPASVLKSEFEDKVAKQILATENHEFLKWTDLKKICVEIRHRDLRTELSRGQDRILNEQFVDPLSGTEIIQGTRSCLISNFIKHI